MLAINGAASVTYISGGLPITFAQLAGGASTHFTWVYQAANAGNVTFSGSAMAIDNISLNPVPVARLSTAASVNIVPAAALNISLFTVSPAQVSIGQSLTVIMRVANGGNGQANNVTPGTLFNYGAGGMAMYSRQAHFHNIPAFGSYDFTWVYTATSAGSLLFSNNATGVDPSRGNMAISAAPGLSNSALIQSASAFIDLCSRSRRRRRWGSRY